MESVCDDPYTVVTHVAIQIQNAIQDNIQRKLGEGYKVFIDIFQEWLYATEHYI